MTHDDSVRVLERLKGGFDKRLSDDLFDIWLEELAHLDFPPAWAAARDIVKAAKYFPRIAEFMAEYDRHRDLQAGPHDHPPCRFCDGLGFVWVEGERNDVVPCSACHTEQWEAWSNGKAPKTKTEPYTVLFVPRKPWDIPDRIDDVPERIARLKDQLNKLRRSPLAPLPPGAP